MDFPTAWRLVGDSIMEDHESLCSYVQSNKAILCDCKYLTDREFSGAEAEDLAAIAEEAAWADQMAAETTVTTEVAVIAPASEEQDDGPMDPLDIPDHYDLPMHGSILACPKCGYETVRTEYHAHGVLSKPCGNRFGFPEVQNLGEHLCRICARCAYGWPEEVLSGTA